MGAGESSSGGGEEALQVEGRSVGAPAHARPSPHESAAVRSTDGSEARGGLAVTQARGGGDLGEALGARGRVLYSGALPEPGKELGRGPAGSRSLRSLGCRYFQKAKARR